MKTVSETTREVDLNSRDITREEFNEMLKDPDVMNVLRTCAQTVYGSGVPGRSAEDLLQTSLMKAVKSFSSFRGNSSFSTWFHQIMINQMRSWIRTRKRRGVMTQLDDEYPLASSHDGPVRSSARSESDRLVRQVIGELDDDEPEIVQLRYLVGVSYQEIADLMDMPLGTVKSTIHRALKKMKRLFELKGVRRLSDF